jgi:hypothetical protein
MEETDDDYDGSESGTDYGQSTAFYTTDNDGSQSDQSSSNEDGTTYTTTTNGHSLTASEGPMGVSRLDPSALINPLTFNHSRKVFAKWMGQEVDDTESTNEGGFSKASF